MLAELAAIGGDGFEVVDLLLNAFGVLAGEFLVAAALSFEFACDGQCEFSLFSV